MAEVVSVSSRLDERLCRLAGELSTVKAELQARMARVAVLEARQAQAVRLIEDGLTEIRETCEWSALCLDDEGVRNHPRHDGAWPESLTATDRRLLAKGYGLVLDGIARLERGAT
jgi:hypothetical protein